MKCSTLSLPVRRKPLSRSLLGHIVLELAKQLVPFGVSLWQGLKRCWSSIGSLSIHFNGGLAVSGCEIPKRAATRFTGGMHALSSGSRLLLANPLGVLYVFLFSLVADIMAIHTHTLGVASVVEASLPMSKF